MIDCTDSQIMSAARAWGFSVSGIRRDMDISGSPQRSEFRCVVECEGNRLYVMEGVHPRMVCRKQAIIDRLDFLAGTGLSGVNPYIRAADGRHLVETNGCFWQVSPFVPGTALPRPEYVSDPWRGEVMADFLIRLRSAARDLPASLVTPHFSILEYMATLVRQIQGREPELFETLIPIVSFVENRLAPVHEALPTVFCHGDFHPLNLIWSEGGIRAVIDWEFCGTKPEMYDAANLIGCVGMENPKALAGPLVTSFIRKLKTSGIFSEMSWYALLPLAIAIRFGWMSEWLRNRDTEMIALEMVYMNLLMTHADDLQKHWGISRSS